MKSIQTKQSHKEKIMLLNPFFESLATIIIQNTQKSLSQLTKGNLVKAQRGLASVQNDLSMLKNSPQFKRLKSMQLNNLCFLERKKGNFENALQLINNLIIFCKNNKMHPTQTARGLLHKCIILNKLHQDNLIWNGQIIRLVKQALDLLNYPSKCGHISNNTKLTQIMVLNFYSIAKQLSFMKNYENAEDLYKKAYLISAKTLGPIHHLTLFLKHPTNSPTKINSKSFLSNSSRLTRLTTEIAQSKLLRNTTKQRLTVKKNKGMLKKTISNKKVHRIVTEVTNNTLIQAQQMNQLDLIKTMYQQKMERMTIKDIIMSKANSYKKTSENNGNLNNKIGVQPQFSSDIKKNELKTINSQLKQPQKESRQNFRQQELCNLI